MNVDLLFDARENWSVLGNIGQGHLLRDVVLTLKGRTEVDVV